MDKRRIKKYEKYTIEQLQEFCNSSTSFRELAGKIGYSQDGGGSIATMHKMVQELNLDCLHFTGQSQKKNLNTIRTPMEDYFTGKVEIHTHTLRLKLIKWGYFNEECSSCHNMIWLNQKIPLELHHKDGNKKNNDLSNLELLCPNCHYFTDTYKSKNRKDQ